MTNQVIQKAAVEAAAKAMVMFTLTEDRAGTQEWDAYARAALEAAAPHMLAEIKSGIDAELQDAPIANYEENNYEAGYVAGLAFALETMEAAK